MRYHSSSVDALNLLAENRGKRAKLASISQTYLGRHECKKIVHGGDVTPEKKILQRERT